MELIPLKAKDFTYKQCHVVLQKLLYVADRDERTKPRTFVYKITMHRGDYLIGSLVDEKKPWGLWRKIIKHHERELVKALDSKREVI